MSKNKLPANISVILATTALYLCLSTVAVAAVTPVATLAMGRTTVSAKADKSVEKIIEATPSDASIGTLTELARQLKVAELQKLLREARAVAKPADSAKSAAFSKAFLASELPPLPSTLAVLPVANPPAVQALGQSASLAGGAVALKPLGFPSSELAIQSTSSMGGKYNALTTDGKAIALGSVVTQGDVSWKVTAITAEGVAFQKCIQGKCSAVTLPVGAGR